MSDFSDKLRLKERAEEDLYFAKRDKELIEALRRQDLEATGNRCADSEGNGRSQVPNGRPEAICARPERRRTLLPNWYRAVLAWAKAAWKRCR